MKCKRNATWCGGCSQVIWSSKSLLPNALPSEVRYHISSHSPHRIHVCVFKHGTKNQALERLNTLILLSCTLWFRINYNKVVGPVHPPQFSRGHSRKYANENGITTAHRWWPEDRSRLEAIQGEACLMYIRNVSLYMDWWCEILLNYSSRMYICLTLIW